MRDHARYLALVLMLLLPLAPLTAQAPTTDTPKASGYPSTSDLTLEFVRVENAHHLMQTLEQLYGRQIIVEDNREHRAVRNLMLLGDNILIHDTPAKVEAIRAGIEMILRKTRDDFLVSSKNVRAEIVLQHIATDEAIHALADLAHPSGVGPQGQTWANLRAIRSRNMIIVNDSGANIEQMKRVIARIDRPRPQILIRCRIVQGSDEIAEPDPRIANLLPAEMKELTRFQHFEMLATGAIRATTGESQPILMQMSGREGLAAELQLRTGGFSAQTGTLQLDRVAFSFSAPRSNSRTEGARPQTQQLTTSTTLPAGEVVVIGALGENPIFVILEMDVIGN